MNKDSASWKKVILLCANATASYICRANVSATGPLLMEEFGLSQVVMGRVFRPDSWGMAMSGFLISIGPHTENAGMAEVSLAFATAFVLCVEGPFWATMMNIAGKISGKAGGIMNMASNLGGLISSTLTPLIATYIGWENALHVAAVLSIVAAVLWLGVSPRKHAQSKL